MDKTKNLTERQIKILKALIEEYISTAEPVGSETLDKKYGLGVSPATIRNEMVSLTELGMLKQVHTSAGRTPTPESLRYYVDHLMKTKDLSVAEEVAVKEKIWDYRQEIDKLLREATKALAQKTKTLAITATGDGDLYYSGASYILDMPEFYDYELTHDLLATLDQYDFWWKIMEHGTDPSDVIVGDQMHGGSMLNHCGIVYKTFATPHVIGAIAVIGPFRLNYPTIVPIVRYMGGLINEFASSW